MDFFEILKNSIPALIIAFAGGSAGAAVVNHLNERWKFKVARKAQKEDAAEEKADRTDELETEVAKIKDEEKSIREMHVKDMKDLQSQMDAQSEALRLLLLDRILSIGKEFIEQEEITFDDRKRFHDMHNCYHDGLGGNGDAKIVVEAVDKLPLKT